MVPFWGLMHLENNFFWKFPLEGHVFILPSPYEHVLYLHYVRQSKIRFFLIADADVQFVHNSFFRWFRNNVPVHPAQVFLDRGRVHPLLFVDLRCPGPVDVRVHADPQPQASASRRSHRTHRRRPRNRRLSRLRVLVRIVDAIFR